MITQEERLQNANNKMTAAMNQQKMKQRKEREFAEKKARQRKYVIGEIVIKYFPELLSIEVGTSSENAVLLKPLESFLSVLSADSDLMESLKKKAATQLFEQNDSETEVSLKFINV